MVPYFVLLITVVLLSVFGQEYGQKRFLKCISVVLIAFAGFRYQVGVDYESYVTLYEDLDMLIWVNEFGFRYLIIFLNDLGFSSQMLFLVCAIIMQFFIYKVITYYSLNYWYSIFIYLMVSTFYIATFNGVRQFLAVGCFLYSLRFLDSKSYFKYILLNFIGVLTFHLTLFLIIPIAFILKKEMTWRYKFFLIIGVVFSQTLISFIFINSPYAAYLSHERETIISGATYLFVLISFFIIFFEKTIPTFNSKTIFVNLNIFSFIVVILAILSNGVIRQLLMRMNSYFFMGYIILIPNIIGALVKKEQRIIAYLVLTLGLGMYYSKTIIIAGEHYNLVPYEFNLNLIK